MTLSALNDLNDDMRRDGYDPIYLEVSDRESIRLLQDLGWTSDEFNGKTVLDVGFSSGLYSLHANNLGASLVTATDSDAGSVRIFNAFVDKHRLPIVLHNTSSSALEPDRATADIVICMGYHFREEMNALSYLDMVRRLCSLTRDILYFEIPWQTESLKQDPVSDNLTENFTLESVIRLLQKYFQHVQLVQFQGHLIATESRNSILIKATDKRQDCEVLAQIPDCNVLDVSLKRGNNNIELLTTPQGAIVLKALPKESMLPCLCQESQVALFDSIAQSVAPLLPPRKYSDTYIFKNENNRHYMVFPFIGKYSDYFQGHLAHVEVEYPLRLAVNLRRSMKSIPEIVIKDIKKQSPPIRLKEQTLLGVTFNKMLGEFGLTSFIESIYSTDCAASESIEDSVIHNDLQIGNMICDPSGKEWVIDMDIMRSGTAYTDFICCAIYNNCSHDVLENEYHRILEINQRPICMSDLHFAMRFILRWISVLNEHYPQALAALARPTLEGVSTVYQFTLGANSDGFTNE